ncbi:MAG: ParB N-terminal domain-containing protein [Alphaproteobacteria bacterium]|nr:ParB N-terminal domain-containing protein [Alphaproteobacteria bacterium]
MELGHIEFSKLSISALNMRHGKKAPDVSDILPSIRARGILVPLLVRQNGSPDTFEVVAGRRRYYSAQIILDERGEIEPLPCAFMQPGDDAAALEASLIENVARLDPDEVTQWETFARLIKEGRTISDISGTFGITERMVKQRLALGNLLPKIREAYRKEEIDAETIRYLTLASKAQQKEWLALFEDPEQHVPRGYQLKGWLFGGQSISTKVALFPLEEYQGQIVSDLFGEDSYFGDADTFWRLQNDAIAAKRAAYLDAGWQDVTVLEQGTRFVSWEHEKTPKKKGGKVFITVSQRGEVEFHEGWLSTKDAKRARQKSDTGNGADPIPAKPSRPEVTSTLQNYIDLHRHAAVRAELADHPGVALRVMVAHTITGSKLWKVEVEPQQTRGQEIAASIAGNTATASFNAKRREIVVLLDLPGDEAAIAGGNGDDYATASVFARLLALSDDDVLRVLAIVMAETLAAGSAMVEALGVYLKLDMRTVWQPDDVFFDLIRDRQAVNAMVAELAGQHSADANIAEKIKTHKSIIHACLKGENGRTKVENWLPRWMAFPAGSYTDRGGFEPVERWERVKPLFAQQ